MISSKNSEDSDKQQNNYDKRDILISLSELIYMTDIPFLEQTQPHKVFNAIWALEGEVNNGGFAQYFANSSSQTATFVITALEIIGAYKTADICKRAFKYAFPDGLPNTPYEIRKSAVSHFDALSLELDPFDREFFNYPDNLTELLFAFVEKHPEEFGDIIRDITGG